MILSIGVKPPIPKNRRVYHNQGFEKPTRVGTTWELIWLTGKGSRSEAIKLERKLKNVSRSRLIEFMPKNREFLTPEGEELLNGIGSLPDESKSMSNPDCNNTLQSLLNGFLTCENKRLYLIVGTINSFSIKKYDLIFVR